MRIDRNKQILNTAAHKYRPLQQAYAKHCRRQMLNTTKENTEPSCKFRVRVVKQYTLYNVLCANSSRSIVTVAPWFCKQPENPEVGGGKSPHTKTWSSLHSSRLTVAMHHHPRSCFYFHSYFEGPVKSMKLTIKAK